jgi:hypothetical protein
MPVMEVRLIPTPDDDTAAAALAAIACLIEQEYAAETRDTPTRAAWRAAALIAAQRLAPARNGAHASWHAADRAQREGRWSYGIVGM